MTSATSLHDRIGRLILEGIHVDVPSAATDLFEAGILDSLAFVELLLRLEREFGIRISIEDVEVEHFRSVERIAEFLARRISLDGPSPVPGLPAVPVDGV